jgi:hypothetical protein
MSSVGFAMALLRRIQTQIRESCAVAAVRKPSDCFDISQLFTKQDMDSHRDPTNLYPACPRSVVRHATPVKHMAAGIEHRHEPVMSKWIKAKTTALP